MTYPAGKRLPHWVKHHLAFHLMTNSPPMWKGELALSGLCQHLFAKFSSLLSWFCIFLLFVSVSFRHTAAVPAAQSQRTKCWAEHSKKRKVCFDSVGGQVDAFHLLNMAAFEFALSRVVCSLCLPSVLQLVAVGHHLCAIESSLLLAVTNASV